MKTPAAVQLLLPEMGGITGFYEARTDRVLCVRCAGTPAGTPIPEPDCGDLHCSRCQQPLRPVNRRDEPHGLLNAGAGGLDQQVRCLEPGRPQAPSSLADRCLGPAEAAASSSSRRPPSSASSASARRRAMSSLGSML